MEIMRNDLVEIKDFPGYFIDPAGNVYNKKLHKLISSVHKSRLYVSLKRNGQYRKYNVGKLVAKTFVPNPNNYKIVSYKNGIYTDVRVENLYWSNIPNHTKPVVPRITIAFECFDENNNYIASIPIDQLKTIFDINQIKAAAKNNTLYKNYYWKCIKSVDALCVVPLSEIQETVSYTQDFDTIPTIKQTLDKAINTLKDERQRNFIEMHFFDGYSLSEIANMYNISKTRVAQILQQATKKLRSCEELRELI